MSLSRALNAPYFGGSSSSSSDVPGAYMVGLDGHSFLVDLTADGFGRYKFHHESIPLLKQQQQNTGNVGANSINPEGLWRVAVEDWHKGAGQTNYDLDASDPARFRSSKGVNVWTKWALSLLPDTAQKRASANTNLALAVAGSRLYLIDGSAIVFTADITPGSPAFTPVTGGPATAPTSITSDGFYVWTSHTANGVYVADTTGTTTASYATGNCTLVRYVKARLMAAYQNSIYNITAAGAIPAALFTHANANYTWVDFAEGLNVIYAAGYIGDKSTIYRTSVVSDGTALGAPVVAGELPDGEIVRGVQGYLGFLLIGTDKGLRIATQDSNGDLTLSALITTTSAVQAFEGQGQYVWFGWSNYDSVSTGLGRIDLTTFNDSAPAYASDLMATGQGAVLSVATFQKIRVFAASGLGFFAESTNKVASGTLDSGIISFGIADSKVALNYQLRHSALAGSVVTGLATNEGSTFATVATSNTTGATGTSVPVAQITAEKFELRMTLSRSGTDATTGPNVTRQVLGVNPQADTSYMIVVPLMLNEIDALDSGTRGRDVAAEMAHIKSLRSSRTVVSYQEGSTSYSVTVEDFYWMPMTQTSTRNAWGGVCVVQLKVVP